MEDAPAQISALLQGLAGGLQAQLNDLKQSYTKLQESHATQIQELKDSQASLSGELGQLRGIAEGCQQKYNVLIPWRESLVTKVSQVKDQADSAITASNEANLATEELRTDTVHLQNCIRTLTEKQDTLTAKLDQCEQATAELKPVLELTATGDGLMIQPRRSAERSPAKATKHPSLLRHESPDVAPPRFAENLSPQRISYGIQDGVLTRREVLPLDTEPGSEVDFIQTDVRKGSAALPLRSAFARRSSVASTVTFFGDDVPRISAQPVRAVQRPPVPLFSSGRERSISLGVDNKVRESIEPSEADFGMAMARSGKRQASLSSEEDPREQMDDLQDVRSASRLAKRSRYETGLDGSTESMDIEPCAMDGTTAEEQHSPSSDASEIIVATRRTKSAIHDSLPNISDFARQASPTGSSVATASMALELLDDIDLSNTTVSPTNLTIDASKATTHELPSARTRKSQPMCHDPGVAAERSVGSSLAANPKTPFVNALSHFQSLFGIRTEDKENRTPSAETENREDITFQGNRRSNRERKPKKLGNDEVTPNEAGITAMKTPATSRRSKSVTIARKAVSCETCRKSRKCTHEDLACDTINPDEDVEMEGA